MIGGAMVQSMLSFGYVVVGLFSVIFLLYTNSFLIKRRKKEFGLFNVLGMEKKHIAKIMMYETIYVAILSIVAGLLGGILFSKLMFLLLLKLLRFEVQMGFEIASPSILSTLALFGAIFVLTLLHNLRQVYVSKPIELLQGGQVGEGEPKTRWLLTLVGLASLGAGYYLALSTGSAFEALTLFFAAVLLVIVGTYCLFTSGSIMLLKMMRSNKRYFYKPNHFTTVSGLMYRMTKNAVGLANICILSTMVLVTLSTTVSLYVGVEDVLLTRYPREITISSYGVTDDYIAELHTGISEVLANHGLTAEKVMEYRMLSFVSQEQGSEFATDRSVTHGFPERLRSLCFIPGEDYSKITGETICLAEHEILIYSDFGDGTYRHETLTALGLTFTVRDNVSKIAGAGLNSSDIIGSYYVIVKNMDVLEQIYEAQLNVHGEYGSQISHYWGFDLPVQGDQAILVYQDIRAGLPSGDSRSHLESMEAEKDEFYSLYGGLFFLGLFLGVLFIMGTVLIIYYKQITEGYEDKERFEVMQKVGMSREEVKKSIRSQVLTVFFLPLGTAAIHIAVAFRFIAKLLGVFSLNNTALFAWCTVGTVLVFALFYALIYAITARVYYKIVSR